MTIRDIAVSLGFEVDKQSLANAEGAVKGLAQFATKALGFLGIATSLRQLNSMAEEFNGINDKIRGATREMGNQKEIQQQILDIANETKTSYGQMADYVTKYIQQDRKLFSDVEKASRFAELTTKALAGAGRSAGEISGAQSYLQRIIANGKLDQGTYTRMMRQYPELVNTIADGLGVTQERLKSMAAGGRITAEKLVQAFENSSDKIQANFNELDYSISDALLHIRNQWGLFVDQMWVQMGITNDVGNMMVKVFNGMLNGIKKIDAATKKFGGIAAIFKTLGMTAMTVGIVKLIPKIKALITFLGGIKAMITPTHLIVLAIIMIVEDFINFLNGNGSVIGLIFEQMGISADDVKEKIAQGISFVKDVFSGAFGVIKELLGIIFALLAHVWKEYGPYIVATIKFIGANLGRVLSFSLRLIQPILRILKGVLQIIKGILKLDWSSIKEGVKNVFGGIFDYIKAWWSGIHDIVVGFAKSVWEWGADLIDAFIGGIKSKIEGVVNIVKDIGKSIADFLHFSEPDKGPLADFHTWMPDFMEGLAADIDDNQGIVLGSVKKLAGGIATLMQNATSKVGTALQGTKSKGGVNQNVTFNNSFTGTVNDAVKNFISASKAQATDTTKMLARAIGRG